MTELLAPRHHAARAVDAASRRHRTEAMQLAQFAEWAMVWWARLLLGVAVWIIFVGVIPLDKNPDGTSALLRQVAYLGMAGLALPLIAYRWRMATVLVVRSWALLIVFGAMASTVLWSQFPAVTIKRIVVYVLLYITAIGIASVLRTPRLFLPPFAAALAAVLFGSFAVTIALPGLAWTDIGLAALQPSKNLAGMVGMVQAIAFAAMLIAVRQPLAFWSLVGLLLLTLFFLVLTLSKTSLGVTLLCVAAVLPALAFVRHSPGFGGLALTAVFVVAGLATAATGVFTLTTADWAQITTGDPTLTQRDDIWDAALVTIERAPWLGLGWGAVWSVWPDFHPLESIPGFWTNSRDTLLILNQSHNGYIDLFLHGGLYLFTIVMLFVVKTIVDVLAAAFRPGGDRWDAAGQCLFGAFFVGMLINNILESTLFYPDGLLGVLLIFLVIAASAWRFCEPKSQTPRRPPATMWVNPSIASAN